MTIRFMIMESLNVGGMDLVRREHEPVKRSCVHPQKSILHLKTGYLSEQRSLGNK